MSILIELKQCEPWPARSLGGRPVNSDEVSWRTLEQKGEGGGGEVSAERRGIERDTERVREID